MAGGLIGMGQRHQRNAIGAFGTVSRQERARRMENERLGALEDQRRVSSVATGAGLGASIAYGTSVGGPVGAVIGAGVGLLANEFF